VPWKSAAQMRWGNSPSGHAALGDAGVNEWNAATKGKTGSLPEKIGAPGKKLGRKSRVGMRPPGLSPKFPGSTGDEESDL
jgi:hypothetical protein